MVDPQRFRDALICRNEEGAESSGGGLGRAFGRRLRVGLGIALAVAACQTGHPRRASIAPSPAPDPLVQHSPLELEFLADPAAALLAEPVPAAIDTSLETGELSIPDSLLEAAWIDAVLERRAPTLGTRARAAVAAQVASAADVHGLDPLVVLSIIAQESRFDPRARGRSSALGLMQLRPFVARDVARRHGIPWEGESTLLDPAHNIAIGTAYLGEILAKFGDLELALAGYNMGPYRLKRMLARGESPKGEYLGRILTHYADLAGIAAALETGSSACAGEGC